MLVAKIDGVGILALLQPNSLPAGAAAHSLGCSFVSLRADCLGGPTWRLRLHTIRALRTSCPS